MPGDLDFSWELSGSGWATCRIADSTSETKHVVSYCTDALADLIRRVASLYDPASSVQRVSFDLEPIEVRWVLRVQDADVTIAIYEFPDISASYDKPESAGKLVWRSKQPPRALLATPSWKRHRTCCTCTVRTATEPSGYSTPSPPLPCVTSGTCTWSTTHVGSRTTPRLHENGGRRATPAAAPFDNARGPRISPGPLVCCALGRIRTCNLLIRSQMLYPLSYECLCFRVFSAPSALREQHYMTCAGTRNPLPGPGLSWADAGNGRSPGPEDRGGFGGGAEAEGFEPSMGGVSPKPH